MTARDLLSEAQRRGVDLRLDGGDLRYRAPAGALTSDLKEALRTRKLELVELLRQEDEVRYRSLQLSDLVDRLARAWRWLSEERVDLVRGISDADEPGDVETLERIMREAVAAFEAARAVPTLSDLAEGAVAAVYFDYGDGVVIERECRPASANKRRSIQ